MDKLTIMIYIIAVMLVIAVFQALYLVTVGIIEDIERRRRWRRKRGFRRGSTRARSTGMWRGIR